MRLVGLTGGIASGKTSVGSVLRDHGVAVVSCDTAAKQGHIPYIISVLKHN